MDQVMDEIEERQRFLENISKGGAMDPETKRAARRTQDEINTRLGELRRLERKLREQEQRSPH